MKPKIVYIAHPIFGDQDNNIKKIIAIVRNINLNEPGVIPFAPYVPDVMALNDADPDERERGFFNSGHVLRAGMVNEMWLFGPTISPGMWAEIKLAEQLNIPVHPKSEGTALELLSYKVQNSFYKFYT